MLGQKHVCVDVIVADVYSSFLTNKIRLFVELMGHNLENKGAETPVIVVGRSFAVSLNLV